MSNTLVHPWKIDPRTGCRLEALGVRPPRRGETGDQPIWPIMGAAEPDDGPEDEPGDDDDDPDDDPEDELGDDDPDAGKSEADLRAELKRLRVASTRKGREIEKWRLRAQGKNGKKDDEDDKDKFTKDDVEDLTERTKEATRAELMPAIIRSQGRSVLESLGMAFPRDAKDAKAALTRTLKLANLDDLELNEDGEVEGLEHELREVKRLYPQLFRGGRVRTPGNAGGGRRPADKPRSATELQMAQAFGIGDDD